MLDSIDTVAAAHPAAALIPTAEGVTLTLGVILHDDPGGTLHVRSALPPITVKKGADAPGILVEDLLQSVVRGLEIAQRGPTKSRAQALAITKLEEALHWLAAR